MRGRTYVVHGVPYTMCVSANEAICIHAAPWQEDAGQAFGVPRSNGCVRMPTSHARWLFNNTPKGTPITIQAWGLPRHLWIECHNQYIKHPEQSNSDCYFMRQNPFSFTKKKMEDTHQRLEETHELKMNNTDHFWTISKPPRFRTCLLNNGWNIIFTANRWMIQNESISSAIQRWMYNQQHQTMQAWKSINHLSHGQFPK